MERLGGHTAGWGRGSDDMDTMDGWGLIWDLEDVEDGGCVEDIKVIINHLGLLTHDDMSSM